MFTRFETTKSTKGASKLRRDLINAEIANLRDLLPLPPSTRQRLSQLQLMALVCVYVRKANYFQQMFKRYDISQQVPPCSNFGFSKALTGFLMMMTQNGKLLYISDNAAEYLGHSMEDLLIHGDSVYDIIDKQDQQSVRNELTKSPIDDEHRIFLCRMNVARNARRQMRFGDQKVVLIRGHFVSYLPLCSRNEPVFLASCTPLAMPETRECIVHGATNVFTTIHTMDMKILHVDTNSEWHLGWERNSLQGISWYQLLHPDCSRDAQTKHRLITQSEQERSCIALLRIQTRSGQFLWTHSVLQVKENTETSQQPVIVCTNQILSNEEALVMKANPWLYHFYSVQSKLHYGLAYDTNNRLYNNISERNPDTQYASAPCINGNQGVVHGNYQTLTAPVMGSYHTSFSYECERRDIGPVDYSVHLNNERYQHLKYYEHRTPSQPTVKRKHKLEESKSITPLGNTSPNTSPSIPNIGGDGPLIASTPTIILPTRRPTLKNICLSEYSSEQNDHWNPSPPWSESPLQKVPDVCQQDLGPYMTTTPPTPSGTPKTYGQNNYSHTFIFEWSPEQYVPHKSATKCHMYTSIENNDSWSRDQRCSFVASSKENEKTQIGEIKAENKMCCDNDNEQHIESPPLNGDLTQNSPDSKKLVL